MMRAILILVFAAVTAPCAAALWSDLHQSSGTQHSRDAFPAASSQGASGAIPAECDSSLARVDSGKHGAGSSVSPRRPAVGSPSSRDGACSITGEANCQLQPDPLGGYNLPGMSDLGIPPTGTAIADDFVPMDDTLTTICVFGTYMDAKGDGPTGPEHYEQFECVWKVPPESESFRIRIYREYTWVPGEPGPLIAEQIVPAENIVRAPVGGAGFESWFGFGMQSWMLTLEDPVFLSTDGTVYWLEVASNRNAVEDASTCYWHWWQTYREGVANDWSMYGTDDRAELGGYAGAGYVYGSGRAVDLQFCLGGMSGPLEFTAPAVPTGSCCDCDDVCTEGVTLSECTDVHEGVWNRGRYCAYPGTCTEEADNCTGAPGAAASSRGRLERVELSGDTRDFPPTSSLITVDTTCYTTDGPEFPDGGSQNALGKDIWFAYYSHCTCELVVSACMGGNYDGGFDSFMAVYHDPDYPEWCLCPLNYPPPPLATANENCNGIPDPGGGIIKSEAKRS